MGEHWLHVCKRKVPLLCHMRTKRQVVVARPGPCVLSTVYCAYYVLCLVSLRLERNHDGTGMIVPLAVIARCVPVVSVLGAVRAAFVAHHQVGGEVDVGG